MNWEEAIRSGFPEFAFEKLSPADMRLAHRDGRAIFDRRRNAPQRFVGKWTVEDEISSKGAEIFVHRKLGVDYRTNPRPDPEGDVGRDWQVRSTKHIYGHLIVYPANRATRPDNPDHVFFFVVGWFPDYRLAGWLLGRDAQQEKYRAPGKDYFMVPQSALHPMGEFFEKWDCNQPVMV